MMIRWGLGRKCTLVHHDKETGVVNLAVIGETITRRGVQWLHYTWRAQNICCLLCKLGALVSWVEGTMREHSL